ncbi:MAG: carbohydrate ABC transporter permease [Chloroflexi bacterium]|nr:carbohydrate ABC transporter permease [Chloroflexota bacterium]
MSEATARIVRERSTTSHSAIHGILTAVSTAVLYVILIVVGLMALLPIVWVALSSFKHTSEIFVWPIVWLPKQWILVNYGRLFQLVPFLRYIGNSFFIAIPSLIGPTLSSSVVAYSFARLRFPFRDRLFLACVSTMLVPGWAVLIPQFLIFKELGWLDSFKPLIVPQLFASPFYVFLLRQFFLGIPKDLDDAARMDGAGHATILFRIIMPLSKAPLAIVGIFSFLGNWNDFLGPLIYLQSQQKYTVAVGLSSLQSEHVTYYGAIMAGTMIALLPPAVLFLLFQRWFVGSIVISGIKG